MSTTLLYSSFEAAQSSGYKEIQLQQMYLK